MGHVKVKREMEGEEEEEKEDDDDDDKEEETALSEEEIVKSTEAEDLTLAELAWSPKPKLKPTSRTSSSSSTGIQMKKNMEKTEKLSNIKRGHSDSKLKHAVSSQAGKVVSSTNSNASTSGRGGVKSSAVIRAEEVRLSLDPEMPSFVKSLVRSHVASCFWMGLPGQFCKLHLPYKDTTIILEDEFGKESKLKYIAYKTGLSAGWRQFSVAHKLIEGDVLVFQLVEPTKFKVYIIRANDLSALEGALGLLNLDAQSKQSYADKDNADMGTEDCNGTKRKRPRSLPITIFQKKKKAGLPRFSLNLGQLAEQFENNSEEVGSEVLEGFKLSKPAVQFKNIKSLAYFNILVDGVPLDSEFSEDIRKKYFNLCCSQNAFLHENLVKGINHKLIVGTISETVNIADAIKASKLTTPRDEFSTWDKTLKAFEHLGMNVRFLRSRLRRIVSLAYESEGATNTREYLEARNERGRTVDEIRNIEVKLVELKDACAGFGAYIESLKSKAESYQLKYQEEATASWSHTDLQLHWLPDLQSELHLWGQVVKPE